MNIQDTAAYDDFSGFFDENPLEDLIVFPGDGYCDRRPTVAGWRAEVSMLLAALPPAA